MYQEGCHCYEAKDEQQAAQDRNKEKKAPKKEAKKEAIDKAEKDEREVATQCGHRLDPPKVAASGLHSLAVLAKGECLAWGLKN